MATVKPVAGSVLLVDDQPETQDGGVVVQRPFGNPYLDYTVAAVSDGSSLGVGPGERVIVADANAGRKVTLDGVVYRVVAESDIIATLEG